MSRLRLDLIVRTYGRNGDGVYSPAPRDYWTWRLWSGSRIVSTSGSQLYSRRADAVNGAAIAGGWFDLANAVRVASRRKDRQVDGAAWRWDVAGEVETCAVRFSDERGQK